LLPSGDNERRLVLKRSHDVAHSIAGAPQ
jgi:hypothetical protein